MKKFGFTLAEVLITLAIIGVVAAMTIPTLVANYQEKSWRTAATVFERKLTEALKVMNTQGTLAGHATTESFVEELSKHLKITNVCQNNDLQSCFSSKITWGGNSSQPEEIDMSKIKSSRNFGQKDWNTNIVGIQLINGINALIAYNPTSSCIQDPYSNQVTGVDCVSVLYDITGFKTPNIEQKDILGLNVVINNGCFVEVPGYGCVINLEKNYSALDTTKDEFKDWDPKYTHSSNYWAGAMKKCSDMGYKLPGENELVAILDYIRKNTNSEGMYMSTYYFSSRNYTTQWGAGCGVHYSSGSTTCNISKSSIHPLLCVE